MKEETRKRRAEQRARWAAAPTIQCSCGAVWKGRAAIDNPVIDAHRQRATCHVMIKHAIERQHEPIDAPMQS